MFLHKNQLSAATRIKRDFLFTNDSLAIFSLLNEIVGFVKIHYPSDVYESRISNCKQILIELLTNGVKHSETDTSIITVEIYNHQLSISKSDCGRRFYLDNYTGWPPLIWPLDSSYVGEKIKIYSDDISQLYAIVENENRISFELLEFPIGTLNEESNLMEHYGLLILTKMSDSFFYHFDAEKSSNVFKSTISFH